MGRKPKNTDLTPWSSMGITNSKQMVFLSAYEVFPNVIHAADASGVSWHNHYRWLRDDSKYAEGFKVAQENGIQALEREAIRRAMEGVKKIRPVFYKGVKVGEVEETDYSDVLLIFMLKGLRPDVYKERIYVDVESQIRQEAINAGFDPDQAVLEAQRLLGPKGKES